MDRKGHSRALQGDEGSYRHVEQPEVDTPMSEEFVETEATPSSGTIGSVSVRRVVEWGPEQGRKRANQNRLGSNPQL